MLFDGESMSEWMGRAVIMRVGLLLALVVASLLPRPGTRAGLASYLIGVPNNNVGLQNFREHPERNSIPSPMPGIL